MVDSVINQIVISRFAFIWQDHFLVANSTNQIDLLPINGFEHSRDQFFRFFFHHAFAKNFTFKIEHNCIPKGFVQFPGIHYRRSDAVNRITAAVVNSGKLDKAFGNTIVLNFEGEILRERMMEEKAKKLVATVLKTVYGQEINLICTVGDQKVILPNESEPTDNDLVDYAINHLDGKLLEGDPFADGKDD